MPEEAARQVKRIIADMVLRVLKKEKFYFAQFIDVFEELPELHQIGMFGHIVEEVGSDIWQRKLADPMKHRELLSDILMHFSGRPNIRGEPDKTELAKLVGGYLKSSHFRDAELEADCSEEDFLDGMKGMVADGR